MLTIKLFLFIIIIFQYLQSEKCKVNALAKRPESTLNNRSNRVQSTSSSNYRQTSALPCRSNPSLCRFALKKLIENKQRCCRARHKSCKRKFFKNCRKPKCYKRQSKKCLKQYKRCARNRISLTFPFRRTSSRQCWIMRPPIKKLALSKRRREEQENPNKKRLKEVCAHDEECAAGLCCARHNHVKICKPLIQEGQVCTREFFTRKRSPDFFERCPCTGSLVCTRSESRHNTCQVPT